MIRRIVGRISLAAWILIGGASGLVLGLVAPEVAKSLELLSTLFLRLIRSIVAPVLFGVLVRGMAGAGSLQELGRVGWKSLVYFEVNTSFALLLGWFAALLLQPGTGLTIPAEGALKAAGVKASTVVENAFPASLLDALARGDVLQIVVFCLLFGAACNAVGPKARPVVAFAETLAEVAFRYTSYVMYAAPVAVGAALASTIAQSGWAAIAALLRLLGTAYVAQCLFLVVFLGGALVLARVPLRRFVRFAREPFLVAFATTSSAAALPSTLENMELFGVSRRILGIVPPLSLSFNPTGSCVHLAMATLFVAQAAGMHLPLEKQLLILLTLKLTSKGVAGIPRANFVVLIGLFEIFGLPLAGLNLLLGVDGFIDMIRTSVNVMGHCVAGPVIAAWEGERVS